jgi:hypothetical protein
MERFDVHVAAGAQPSLTTKDTKNTEKILFRLGDLCGKDLGRKFAIGFESATIWILISDFRFQISNV